MNSRERMPSIFFGHGSPMNALEDNAVTRQWRALANRIPKPEAIVCVSAHWRTRGTAVTAMPSPPTIHDFGGFPAALHAVRYPAPGSVALAGRLRELLADREVTADQGWGLDHGTWSVLVHLYPDAEVPVVQLSLDAGLDAAGHYRLARQLAPLRAEGVLLMGSGNIVHNLMRLDWTAAAPAQPWAERFDSWVADRIEAADCASLVNYASQGADARLAVPTDEHYLPLLYCLAVREPADDLGYACTEIFGGTISMRSVLIGLRPPSA